MLTENHLKTTNFKLSHTVILNQSTFKNTKPNSTKRDL